MYTPLFFFCRHSYGEQFSKSKWMKEMVGQRELLSAFAGIPLEDIRGMRAPFLAVRAPFKGRSRYIVSMVLSNSFSVRIEVCICVRVITFLTHALAKIGARNICLDRKEKIICTHIQSKQGCHKGEFEKILSQIIGAGLKNDMSIIYFFFQYRKIPQKGSDHLPKCFSRQWMWGYRFLFLVLLAITIPLSRYEYQNISIITIQFSPFPLPLSFFCFRGGGGGLDLLYIHFILYGMICGTYKLINR